MTNKKRRDEADERLVLYRKGKTDETRVRRKAERQALILVKSRRRDPLAVDFNRFILEDESGVVVFGNADRYDKTLDEVEAFLTTPPSERKPQ